MCSSSSEPGRPPGVLRGRPRAAPGTLLVLLVCAALGLPPTQPLGGEPTSRGSKANIVWLDEKGQRHEEFARQIFYGYSTRTYLKVPKDGRNFKDEISEVKAIPLAGNFTSFSKLDFVGFSWEPAPDSDVPRLLVKLKLINGEERSFSGASLAGAPHPVAPYLTFTVDGSPRRIEIQPLSTESDRAGKPALVSIQFVL